MASSRRARRFSPPIARAGPAQYASSYATCAHNQMSGSCCPRARRGHRRGDGTARLERRGTAGFSQRDRLRHAIPVPPLSAASTLALCRAVGSICRLCVREADAPIRGPLSCAAPARAAGPPLAWQIEVDLTLLRRGPRRASAVRPASRHFTTSPPEPGAPPACPPDRRGFRALRSGGRQARRRMSCLTWNASGQGPSLTDLLIYEYFSRSVVNVVPD